MTPVDAPYMERYYHPGWLERSAMAVAEGDPVPSPVAPLPPPPPPDAPADDGGLDLDTPALAPVPSNEGLSAGPLSNLVFGGTLDYRFLFSKEMPEGMFAVHVNELFLTTNVGDHITILAEQLLVTSDLGTSVGQDHGFVYMTISNLQFLPPGMALRVGRMRLKYGVDAKLDAPANPLRTTEYRTLGQLSDRAIEVAGFIGPVDYVVSVSQGPDYVLQDVIGADGQVAGAIKVDAENRSRPVQGRVGTTFHGVVPNFGLSGYYGKNYDVHVLHGFDGSDDMLFGGEIDRHTLVLKQRASADVRWDVWKLRFAGEYTLGRDLLAGDDRVVQGIYARADLSLVPRRLSMQLQYDRFADGRADPVDTGSVSVTGLINDESWLRGFVQAEPGVFTGDGGWLAGSQLLVAF